MRLDPFLVPEALARQRLNILVDGPAALVTGGAGDAHAFRIVPEREMGSEPRSFVLPDARAPAGFGLNDDRRSLGVALEWISLEDFPVDALGHRSELRAEEAGSTWAPLTAEGSVRGCRPPCRALVPPLGRGPCCFGSGRRAAAARPRGAVRDLDLNGWRIPAFDVALTGRAPGESVARPPAAWNRTCSRSVAQRGPLALPPSRRASRCSGWSWSVKALRVGALLAALLLLFFSPVLLTGKLLAPPGDGLSYYYPVRVHAAEITREGRLPLWSPALFAGFPLLADIEVGALYPPNALFLVLPPPLALNLLIVLTFLLAGVSTFLY
jgi:hypothetical protein